ncbi:hypothetical protein HZA55_04545 [Candidatus Poribacteria bacterium]|nr:hypothetical protein [Candidatus Poribacteria bacterium]
MIKRKKHSKNEKRKNEKSIDNKELLQRMGRYSAIAAVAILAPSLGCINQGGNSNNTNKTDSTVIDNTGSTKIGGSTYDSATLINVNDTLNVSLNSDKNTVYYKFTAASSTILKLFINSVSGEARCSLYSNIGNIASKYGDTHSIKTSHTTTFQVEPGTYFIKFSSVSTTVSIVSKFTTVVPGSWANSYSDLWTNNYSDTYSDWTNNYSDWTNNYSDWNNRWSHAYSDWSNAWGNWMQSW